MEDVCQGRGVRAYSLFQLRFRRPVVFTPDDQLGAGCAVAPVVISAVLVIEQRLVGQPCRIGQLADQLWVVSGNAGRRLQQQPRRRAGYDQAGFGPGVAGYLIARGDVQIVKIDIAASGVGHGLDDLVRHDAAADCRYPAAPVDDGPDAKTVEYRRRSPWTHAGSLCDAGRRSKSCSSLNPRARSDLSTSNVFLDSGAATRWNASNPWPSRSKAMRHARPMS